jgi:hypothetical protein
MKFCIYSVSVIYSVDEPCAANKIAECASLIQPTIGLLKHELS